MVTERRLSETWKVKQHPATTFPWTGVNGAFVDEGGANYTAGVWDGMRKLRTIHVPALRFSGNLLLHSRGWDRAAGLSFTSRERTQPSPSASACPSAASAEGPRSRPPRWSPGGPSCLSEEQKSRGVCDQERRLVSHECVTHTREGGCASACVCVCQSESVAAEHRTGFVHVHRCVRRQISQRRPVRRSKQSWVTRWAAKQRAGRRTEEDSGLDFTRLRRPKRFSIQM